MFCEEVRAITKDGERLIELRSRLKHAGFQEHCMIHGFYGLAFSSRKLRRSDAVGSIPVYYDSGLDQIVVFSQERGHGVLKFMGFERLPGLGTMGEVVRQQLDDVFLLNEELSSPNGKLLEWVRAVLEELWQECWIHGFVSRPQSRRKDHNSAIPGSIILLYDSRLGEMVLCWQRDLTGPVQIASFGRMDEPATFVQWMFETIYIKDLSEIKTKEDERKGAQLPLIS